MRLAIALLAASALAGCTVVDIATAPVRVVKTAVDTTATAVDAVTTSQSEADEKRGREMRQRDERLGKLARQRNKLTAKCADGSDAACAERESVEAEIEREMSREI